MTAETVTANEEYILTIHIDAEYLRDEDTLYPITIDPTIEISYTNNGAGAIQDIVVNSADPLSGTDGEISAGKWGSDQSISRILMKFPHLNLNGIPYSESVTSAKVYIHDLMCQHDELTLECYPFIGPSWSESNATWSNTNQTSTGILGPKLSQHIISYYKGLELDTHHSYGFDITAAVQGWKSGTYDQAKGIIFKASSANESATAHNYKTFASYNRANHKPYLVVGYDSYIPNISFTVDDLVCLRMQSFGLEGYVTTVPDNATVTYTALDFYVTVNSSTGMVTPKNIGSCAVRASITVNGITYSDTVNIHVVLTRTYGVYKLNSVENGNNLDVCDGKISGQVAVNHWQDDGTLKQLWRIKHIGKGQYTIRPMHNPNMLLAASGTSVYVVENTTDGASLINTTYAWKISSPTDRDNSCIQNASIPMTTTNTLSVSFTDYSTCLNEYEEVQEYGWMITSVSYTPRILLYDTSNETLLHDTAVDGADLGVIKILHDGKTRALSDYYWRVIHSSNSALPIPLTWTATEGSSNVYVDSATGSITGLKMGNSTIKGSVTSGSTTLEIRYGVQVVLDGEYFIKNKETGRFVDIQNETFADEQQIEQMTFDGGRSQKWIFSYSGNGYYHIRVLDNNAYMYYLGVLDDSEENDTPVVLREWSEDAESLKWKVEYTDSGAFKITPKTGEYYDRVLAVGSYIANIDGIDIEQRDYVEDENYKDEWEIEDIDETRFVYVDLLYDNAYLSRYSDAVSRINAKKQQLKEVFLYNFNVIVEFSEPQLFSSYADLNCSTSHHSSCTHANDPDCYNSGFNSDGTVDYSNYHHKNIYNIMLRIPFPDTSSMVRVAFIGHNTCATITIKDKNGTSVLHKPNPYYGLAYEGIGLATVMNFNSTASETKTFVHEFGHLYGAPDHYGGDHKSTLKLIDETGDSRFNEECIYGEQHFDPSVVNNLTICAGCKAVIERNRNKYNHT